MKQVKIVSKNWMIEFYQNGQEAGPVTRRLYDLLTAIQCGDHEAPKGWIVEIS